MIGTDYTCPHGEPPGDCPQGCTAVGAAPGEEKQDKKSASTVLVEIAQAMFEFGVSETGETYGVPKKGARVVFLLRGGKKSLRAQLARTYFQATGRAAPAQALADALLVIEGLAEEKEESKLHLRVARHDGALWLDLAGNTGAVVKLRSGRWSVQSDAPILFKRTSLNSPLPEPEPGGELSELWGWLNVAEEDRPLVVAWLVSVLFADIPHPVLVLTGEQGTGKTTAMKVLTLLLDPSPVPARKPPKDPESWVTAASGSWVVGLDNLSEIQGWLSDSICRAVTGDGDVRRRLYTDGDFAVFAFRRCLILNGIDLGAMRGDLAERMLPIELHRIEDTHRLEEEQLWPEWEKVHPRLLGALLCVSAGVAGVLPSVHLETKPRMADFARILAAVDQMLGTTGLDRYIEKQGALARESLSDDDFAVRIAHVVSANSTFEGTSADLLTMVTPSVEFKPPKGWPTTARQVTNWLRRQAPVLRKAGWVVEDDAGNNHNKALRWELTPPALRRTDRNPDPRHPQDPRSAGVAGVAGVESGPLYNDEATDPLWDELDSLGPSGESGRCALCGRPSLHQICAACEDEHEREGDSE